MATVTTRIAVLGSTGSIGTQTLDVIRNLPGRFEIVALASGRPSQVFDDQVTEFRPKLINLRDVPNARYDGATTASLMDIVTHHDVDVVLMATPGGAGIGPTVAALDAGKPVALANKEALVAAGSLATAAAKRGNVPILPVDSEHSAIWQCLHDAAVCVPPCPEPPAGVERLILTASGGAFRDWPIEKIAGATAEEALKHPNWSMGPKVTVDSATLFNKGLELIEAHWLFGVPYDRLSVIIHRESIIHSMVEFADRSIKAQLGVPDMRLPIQYALTFPERVHNNSLPPLSLGKQGTLTFLDPDDSRYPCLRMAIEAGDKGGTYPAAMSGADESAVDLFMRGAIQFGDISALIRHTLDAHIVNSSPDINSILAADQWARSYVTSLVAKR